MPRRDRAAALDTYLANLAWAAERAAGRRRRHPDRADQPPRHARLLPHPAGRRARGRRRSSARRNLKVQLDLYHCQIIEGDLTTTLRRDLPTGRVGHLQIAGVPDRHEPDAGELNIAPPVRRRRRAGLRRLDRLRVPPPRRHERGARLAQRLPRRQRMRIVITGGFGFLGPPARRHSCSEQGTFRGAPIDRAGARRPVRAGRVAAGRRPARGGRPGRPDRPPRRVVRASRWTWCSTSRRRCRPSARPTSTSACGANVDTTRALLEAARAQSAAGGPGGHGWCSPAVSRCTAPTRRCRCPSWSARPRCPPRSPATASRSSSASSWSPTTPARASVDGRVARLMTVSVRPGKPNAAASGFLSGDRARAARRTAGDLPGRPRPAGGPRLAAAHGRRASCPSRRSERGERAGPARRPAAGQPAGADGHASRRCWTRCGRWPGTPCADLVTMAPDPRRRGHRRAPGPRSSTTRARAALGLRADPDFESVVREYLADHADAVAVGTALEAGRLDRSIDWKPCFPR